MREPPSQIAPAAIRAVLRAAYGLAGAELTFLPIGHDAAAWVYRVELENDAPRFLKLRLGPLTRAAAMSSIRGLFAPGEIVSIATHEAIDDSQ